MTPREPYRHQPRQCVTPTDFRCRAILGSVCEDLPQTEGELREDLLRHSFPYAEQAGTSTLLEHGCTDSNRVFVIHSVEGFYSGIRHIINGSVLPRQALLSRQESRRIFRKSRKTRKS